MLGPCAGGARLLALVFCAAIGLPLALSQIAQLTAFSPANGPSSGGSTFTIHGLHFGLGTSVVKARISGTACKSTKWISDTSMRAVTSGAGISFQDAIVVTFAGVVVHTENSAFTFDAPVLSATGGNSPAHAAGTLTLTGNGFGIYDTSPKARIGDTACLSTKWASYNRITCTIPPGTASGNGKSASMVLSVASSAAGKKTVSKAFSYDVPSITALFDGTGAMANGPAAGGNTITATGENFGTYDATSVAIIGGTSGGSIWTSDTSMGIVVAAGVQAGHAVAISMDSQYGSGLSTAYDYDPPAVSTLSLANGPATGAESLTVFGLNFGTADYSPLVSLGGKVCASSTWRSDSEIVCVTPTNVGSANDVDLIMLSKASTLSSSYSYDAPSVTSVHVANAPPMGTIVASIMGKNFGTDGSKHIARGKILSSKGGGVCSSSQRASDNLLLCTIPPGAGGDAEVTVDYVGGKAEDIGTLTLAFTYDAPVVLIFDPMFAQQLNVAPGTQTEITITGTNFGTADYDAIAMVGDTVCTSTTWKSDTALMCTVAEGFGDTHAIVVSLESKFNTYTDAVSYDKPAIAQMIPQNGPAGAETEITLLGLNFGSSQYTQTVKVGASMASNVRWTSDSAIVCAAPMGRGVALTVAVDQFLDDGDGGAHEGYFTYDDPVVTGTSLTNGPQSGGFVITVSGASFGGNLQGNFEMYVGASVCNAASWHSDSSIECELQPGFGRVDLSLRLWPSQTYCTGHQGLCLASHVGAFVYDGPNPTGLEGTMNGPSSGSNIVTVTGTLFGVTDPGVELIAKIGETNCSSTTWVSPTSLSCNVNPGVGSRDVHVYLAGVTNGIKRAYSYNAPTLDAGAWSVSEGPQAGGVLIPVTGTNFGDQAGHSESGISIDGVDCNIAEWISSSSVIVSSAPGVKQPGGNVVKIGAPGALPEELTKIGDWSFHQPMILGANPTQIPGLEEGNNLTVTGVNFGGFDSSPTIFIGSEDKACASSMWVSDSAIICSTPLNTDGKKDVAYLSGAKGSTGKDLKLELDASVVANNVTVLQAASNGSNSTELNVSAAYAARANKLVEFLDVPKHVLSFVSIAVTADQCDRDTTVDIGMGITMELKAGWCIADSIGEGSNMVAYVTSSASAPFSRDSANSTVPASQVLLGLAFRSVTLAGPVEVKAPLDLNMISQSVERRRRLLQYGGKILKQAWLNQCTGKCDRSQQIHRMQPIFCTSLPLPCLISFPRPLARVAVPSKLLAAYLTPLSPSEGGVLC